MKKGWTGALTLAITAVVAVVPSAALRAQEPASASGFATDFVADLQRVGGRLVQLAEAVPEDKFSWRPTEEVRRISEVYVHVVFTNMFMPMALGAPAPEGIGEMPENPMSLMQEWEAQVTTKDEVIAKLKESFAYAAQAVPAISDLDTEVQTFGFPASKRAYLLILLTHAHEHLGQSIAYARSIGVVPPWSQQQAGAAEGDAGGQDG